MEDEYRRPGEAELIIPSVSSSCIEYMERHGKIEVSKRNPPSEIVTRNAECRMDKTPGKEVP